MDILAAMDRVAVRSGLYRLTFIDRPRPRTMRWLPVFGLAAVLVGYLLMVRGQYAFRWSAVAGSLLFWASYGLSIYLRFFGPRLIDDPRAPLDERERLVKAQAGALTGTVLVILAIAACYYQGLAAMVGWPRVASPTEWFYLGIALQTAWMLLSVLTASWLQPPVAPDDDA